MKTSGNRGTPDRQGSAMAATIAARAYRRLRREVAERRAQPWVRRGRRFLDSGELEQALVCCRKALSVCRNSYSAHCLMSEALMPGDNYKTFLQHLHECLRPKTYVEIGIADGSSLALAGPETKAVGIDPMPDIRARIGSQVKLYALTSDEFFERHDLLAELGSPTLDLAFLDGLHQFGQALKDFINIERYSCTRTVVLIHDCLPVTRLVAAPIRATDFWCGDVWKIIPCLRKYRADLNVQVVPARPSGLAIVTQLDSNSTLLQDRLEAIVAEYRDQDLSYEYLDIASLTGKMSNVVPNDWKNICRDLVSESRGVLQSGGSLE
jgi:hypothetical protein